MQCSFRNHYWEIMLECQVDKGSADTLHMSPFLGSWGFLVCVREVLEKGGSNLEGVGQQVAGQKLNLWSHEGLPTGLGSALHFLHALLGSRIHEALVQAPEVFLKQRHAEAKDLQMTHNRESKATISCGFIACVKFVFGRRS